MMTTCRVHSNPVGGWILLFPFPWENGGPEELLEVTQHKKVGQESKLRIWPQSQLLTPKGCCPS